MEGTIKFYNQEKGYGFIKTASNQDLFFHISSCSNFIPEIGCRVSFETETTEKGLKAINIKIVNIENKFIAFGNERIKTNNIKNYGISNDSEKIIKRINNLEDKISDISLEISRLEEERNDKIEHEIQHERDVTSFVRFTSATSSSGRTMKEIEELAKKRVKYITNIIEDKQIQIQKKREELNNLLNSQEYGYAKNGKLIYLYITTYQGDNFKYYLDVCGFDIYKKLLEIDMSFGIEK